jgi:hypothetical protein
MDAHIRANPAVWGQEPANPVDGARVATDQAELPISSTIGAGLRLLIGLCA